MMAVVYAPAASLGQTDHPEATTVLRNAAVGEVWLWGQSNMGWSVGNSFEAEGEAGRSSCSDLPFCSRTLA